VLLAFYALCAVCPGRLLPVFALQAAETNDSHDCNNRKQKSDSDCRIAFAESLPPSAEKFAFILSSHASLSPVIFAHAFEGFSRLRPIRFSTAGPPAVSLKPVLRI
jgi:hypothetical protein